MMNSEQSSEAEMNGQSEDRKPGPNIIRAWFDTVINPLLDALEVEKKRADRCDWTWNHWHHTLEAIQPIDRLIDVESVPNLRQFQRFHPEVKEMTDAHDHLVNELLTRCLALQQKLEQNAGMNALYGEATSEHALQALGTTMEALFGNSSREENIATLAEYMMNARKDLPSYYGPAPLWNAWGERFAALLESDGLRLSHEAVTDVGGRLSEVIETLSSMLTECRELLSIEHDVPIVESSPRNRAA